MERRREVKKMKCPKCGKGEIVAYLKENIDCLLAIAMKAIEVKCDSCGWENSINVKAIEGEKLTHTHSLQ